MYICDLELKKKTYHRRSLEEGILSIESKLNGQKYNPGSWLRLSKAFLCLSVAITRM